MPERSRISPMRDPARRRVARAWIAYVIVTAAIAIVVNYTAPVSVFRVVWPILLGSWVVVYILLSLRTRRNGGSDA